MLIWIIMAIFLVVIVAGGFTARARRGRSSAGSTGSHPGHKGAGRNHRGRGRH